jgi:dihydroorotate dehydrogenase
VPDTYRLLRNVAFRFDPERVHHLALRSYAITRPRRIRTVRNPSTVMGLTFPNVVGLAAGYDKDARGWRGLAALGFGHIEVGTVTPQPQPGNPRPRLFRLPSDGGLINRLGFPSDGADAVAGRLSGPRPGGVVLGVSIGPNGFSGLDQAASDYERLVDRFASLADYLAINVSSPNTPGLRTLESESELKDLLVRVVARRDFQAAQLRRTVPLVIKLSPDIPLGDLAATVGTIEAAGVDGIVVTNTTRQRPTLNSKSAAESGGLSGAPLRELSLEVLRKVKAATALPLIASGGIMTVGDAAQRLEEGASLVQLYSGFVYGGPRLVRSTAQLDPRQSPAADS